MLKVIFHVDDTTRWPLVLGNAENLLRAAKEKREEAEVEVLANALAVVQCVQQTGDELQEQMCNLSQKKVRFAACNNSMHAQGIAPASLLPFVQVVPAGVLELAERQNQGYAYIKP
ncbi:MAG: DsrE family protein [Pygmaiobacter sp.]|nr:DsrE family protein [Pygmaiobacter sp.]